MMAILKKKVRSETLVVTDIINQIKKFKLVITNKGFINFVKQSEIIQLDLESSNHIKEIANTTNITDIVARLLKVVRKEWAKI